MKLIVSPNEETVGMEVTERMKIVPKLHRRLQEVRPSFFETLRYDTV
jgi:hypothetical protein